MKEITLLLFIFTLNYVHAQPDLPADTPQNSANSQVSVTGIHFLQSDYERAKFQAKEEGKPLFLDIYTQWSKPCKQMDKFVFSKEEVGQRFNESFINLKIDGESEEGKKLAEEFGVFSYPTYVFVSNEGDLIYKVKGAMTPHQLISEASKARNIAKDFKPLHELEVAYEAGNRDHRFLYEYLRQKSNKAGRQPDLLEVYVANVPKSELQTEKVLAIISKNVRSVESLSFDILKNALKNFDSFTDGQRTAIIRGITLAKKLTFKRIIETNDKDLFSRLIEAVYATSYSNAGALAEEKQFRFDLAKLTLDFVNYNQLAEEQAQFLMNKTADEMALESSNIIENFKREAEERNISEQSAQYQDMLKSLTNSVENSVSYQLNELAWGYVLMAETRGDIERAIRWINRSIALAETPVNLDTKANLLYRLGQRKEAIKLEKRAIKLGKKTRVNTVASEKALKLMKRRLPINFSTEIKEVAEKY